MNTGITLGLPADFTLGEKNIDALCLFKDPVGNFIPKWNHKLQWCSMSFRHPRLFLDMDENIFTQQLAIHDMFFSSDTILKKGYGCFQE